MIPQSKLDEWKALADKASKGPWVRYQDKLRPNFSDVVITEIHSCEKTPIVKWGGFDDSERSNAKHKANATFIAASREAVPALLAEVERLNAIIRSKALDEIAEFDGGIMDDDKPKVT